MAEIPVIIQIKLKEFTLIHYILLSILSVLRKKNTLNIKQGKQMQLTIRFPVIRETNAINKKNAAEADDESPECCPLQMVERAPVKLGSMDPAD